VKKRSDGTRVVVFLLAAVAAGFVVRWRCNRKDDAPPPPPPPPVTTSEPAKPADAATVATIDAAVVPPPAPRYTGNFAVAAISTDGAHVLLASSGDAGRLRMVAVDGNAIEADLAVGDLTSDTAAAEISRAVAVLRGFPLGAAHLGHIATNPDGTRSAVNIVDDTHLFADGKIGAKLPLAAAYSPLVASDGKTLLVSGYDGRTSDGDGKYSLFAVPIAGGKPVKVDGTDGYDGAWALSRSGMLTIVVGQGPLPICVVQIPLAARPLRATKRVCPDHATKLEVELSPSGDWIAWTVDGDQRRTRSMELATERVDLDSDRVGQMRVSDRGVVVIAGDADPVVWDPDDHRMRPAPQADPSCVFRSADELVCPTDDGVSVVKLR
jgi:hypothetical protein